MSPISKVGQQLTLKLFKILLLIMKSPNKHSSQTVINPDNTASKLKTAYERDDGYPTDEQLEAIKKLVPQKDFSGAKSLFD